MGRKTIFNILVGFSRENLKARRGRKVGSEGDVWE